MNNLILFLFISQFSYAGRFSDFCESYIIADDPYQFEYLTVDQLVDVYFTLKNNGRPSQALINEMKFRLSRELTYEEREILFKTLGGE